MRLVSSLLFIPVVACGSAPPVTPQRYSPSEVAEAAAVPNGYESGGRLHAECTRVALGRDASEASLDDVDCSFERLTRVLKARAGEESASLIVGKRCRGSARALSCSAAIARPGPSVSFARRELAREEGPAPSAAQVLDLDEPRPQDAAQISVAFRASAPAARRALPARAYDSVAETAQPSVGRPVLGQVAASCQSCETNALRHALRVAAGRAGAGEISAVRFFQDDARSVCIASALVPWSS